MDAANLSLGPLPILAWIPLLPLLGALINLVAGRWMRGETGWVPPVIGHIERRRTRR